MSNLSPTTILQRAPGLTIGLRSDNSIRITLNGQTVECGRHGLAILDTFYRPTSLSQAVNALRTVTTGKLDAIALTEAIVGLHQAGVLRDGTAPDSASLRGLGWNHVLMLNDRVRTESFLAAVRETVRTGDVVVDVGTGTGILAIEAARAGARHVYAVECTGAASSARALVQANGLSDRITVVHGWSTQIDLPERADVLVTELVGDDPLGEEILEVALDAHRRLLKPGARIVPETLDIMGFPVSIPRAALRSRVAGNDTLRRWQAWYELDFSPLSPTEGRKRDMFSVRGTAARRWKPVSEPVRLARVDLRHIEQLAIDTASAATATRGGRLNGILLYVDLKLAPSTSISTHPATVGPDCSWSNIVWAFDPPLSLHAGDGFAVTFRHRSGTSGVEIAAVG